MVQEVMAFGAQAIRAFFNSTKARFATAIVIVLTAADSARAQVQWQIVGADCTINGHAHANEHAITGPLTWVDEFCNINGPFLPSVIGSGGVVHEFGRKCFREAQEEGLPPAGPPPLWTQAVIKARAFIDGDNTDNIRIEWLNLAYCDQFTDGHRADAEMRLSFDIDLQIVNGPAGAQVLVYYYWDAFGGATTRHECLPGDPFCGPPFEDPVRINNVLSVGNQELLGGRFNFASPNGLPGWNALSDQSGFLAAQVGDTIRIHLTSDGEAHLRSPEPSGIQTGPEADAIFRGTLRLTVGYVAPPTPPVGPEPQIEFSLDIGSDSELSDPNANGNEVFDPGDCYPMRGPALPVCGADGVRDDALIFGFDFPPSTPDCGLLSAAPVCSGNWNPSVWFNLDGTDSLDFSLAQWLPPGALGPIPYVPSDCIYSAENLLISFDDDQPGHYAGGPGPGGQMQCNVPVNSFAANTWNKIYGTTADRDEVVYVNAPINSTVPPTASLAFVVPYAHERDVHISLSPNPDNQTLSFDDDVNALDAYEDSNACVHWYFSVDHQATGFDPINGTMLDPGHIYEVVPGQGPVVVVDHAIHLGLPDGVDINAFEFVWLYTADPALNGVYLALLFSVDVDDPLTPMDESAGLHPGVIYASLLNGTHFQYSTTALGGNIDAITTWQTWLISPPPPPPSICPQNLLVWRAYFPPNPPPRRTSHKMAFDSLRGRGVLFGGVDAAGQFLGDTWEWDGAHWQQVHAGGPGAPSARLDHAMAYDSARGVTVLYGGIDVNGQIKEDTWEWDGATWQQRSPGAPNSAMPRHWHAMAYDASRGVTVLIGGMPSIGPVTWEWDGAFWTAVTTPNFPGIGDRHLHAMTYDGSTQRVLLFGGIDAGALQNDLWAYDGIDWSPLTTASPLPSPRANAQLVHDGARGLTVLFGGGPLTPFVETWEWDNANWVQQLPASTPNAREFHTMIYDEARCHAVVFGGQEPGGVAPSDVWTYPDNAASGARIFCVVGAGTGLDWSWSISGPGGGGWTVSDLNVPALPAGVTADQLAHQFTDRINNAGCCTLQAQQLSLAPQCFEVTAGDPAGFDLCVGTVGVLPGCCVTAGITCSFNPDIFEVFPSGADCDGNGVDDAIEIAIDPSLDANNDGILDACQTYLRGDLNCDGQIDGADVGPLTLALTQPADYAALYPGCNINAADMNSDGVINLADVADFVQTLVGP